jgi:hypothetical protein
MPNKLNTFLLGTTLIVFITGCASPDADAPIVSYNIAPKPDVAIVRQTLQTYQAGKTTFADFKRDAGLVMMQRPSIALPKLSYLGRPPAIPLRPQSTTPDQAKSEPVTYYGVPAGSPWILYGFQDNMNINRGTLTETHTFFVGDINHVISILEFDKQGNLTKILPYQ